MKYIFSLLLFANIFWVPQAQALSCVEAPPPQEQFNQAIAVFSGRAVEVDNVENGNPNGKNKAQFDVYKVWKGNLPDKLTIETDGTWGMRFEQSKEYLVYLDKLDPYVVELCRFGTEELSTAQEKIAMIEALGFAPKDPEPAPDQNPISNFLTQSSENRYLGYGLAVATIFAAYLTYKHFYR